MSHTTNTAGKAKHNQHSMRRDRLYNIWSNMKQRCENPNHHNFRYYGGRGITVCDEWHTPNRFFEWALANGYAKELTIDRIDNDGPYAPWNCRWVDLATQCRNRGSNRLIEYRGEQRCLMEWAEITGISFRAIWRRLNRGWPVERALTTPTCPKHHNKCSPVIIEWNGVRHTRKEWSQITGISSAAICARLKRGWTVERTLATPLLK